MDRIQTQEEIQKLIDEVFSGRDKLTYEDYQKVIETISSEMFLSIMILLQSCLPCTENFNRYKKNYEKFLGQTPDAEAAKQTGEGEVKTIASPKLMSKLSPLAQMGLGTDSINFNPNAQKVLL